MKYLILLLSLNFMLTLSCNEIRREKELKNNFTVSFGSCNNQNLPNFLWREILENKPDLFIWGGDIIYSDTYDMQWMKKNYEKQKNDSTYQNFISKVPVLGTWDDHDYGLNDGGEEYEKKDSVQQIFLDFFDVYKQSPRRFQKGVYFSEKYGKGKKSVLVIVLDTRYFRSKLTKDSTGVKRYIPNKTGEGTMLGDKQWKWLETTLNNSNSSFNIIVSSIQVLSSEHGFETWGNMPHEVKKLESIIANSKVKGVIILSGDRHIAEISSKKINGLNYPLLDVTSSGLTHSYESFKGELNPFRVSKVVPHKNFGVLKINFTSNSITIEIRGENNLLYQSYLQKYKN